MRPNAEPAACPPGKAFYGRAVVWSKHDEYSEELDAVLVRQFTSEEGWEDLDEEPGKPWLVLPDSVNEAHRAADADITLFYSLGNTRELRVDDLPSAKEMRQVYYEAMNTGPRNRRPAFQAVNQLVLDKINGSSDDAIDPYAGCDTWEGRAAILARDSMQDRRTIWFLRNEVGNAEGSLEDSQSMLTEAQEELRQKQRYINTLHERVQELESQLRPAQA